MKKNFIIKWLFSVLLCVSVLALAACGDTQKTSDGGTSEQTKEEESGSSVKESGKYVVIVYNGTDFSSAEYAKGTEVTLTARQEDGKEFVSWNKNGEVYSYTDTVLFEVDENVIWKSVYSTRNTVMLDANGGAVRVGSRAYGVKGYEDEAVKLSYKIGGVPEIFGTVAVGEVLTLSLYPVDGGCEKYTFRWQRAETENGPYTDIAGATEQTYILTSDDADKYVRALVTATGDYYGTVATDSTPIVKKAARIAEAEELKISDGVGNSDYAEGASLSLLKGLTFKLPVPKYTHYTFLGWFNGEEQVTDEEGVSLEEYDGEAVTLTAEYEENDKVFISLGYERLSEGDAYVPLADDTDGHYYIETGEVRFFATTVKDMECIGWYDGEGNKVSDENNNSALTVQLTKLDKNEYGEYDALSFVARYREAYSVVVIGGTGTGYYEGEEAVTVAPLSSTGKTFASWQTVKEGVTYTLACYGEEGTLCLIYSDGGTDAVLYYDGEKKTDTYENLLSSVTVMTEGSFSLKDWQNLGLSVSGQNRIYATYNSSYYTLRYELVLTDEIEKTDLESIGFSDEDGDGIYIYDCYYEYGQLISWLKLPTVTHYTFGAWQMKTGGDLPSNMPVVAEGKALTVLGTFVPEKYKITVRSMANGMARIGSTNGMESGYFEYGSKIYIYVTAYEGYRFDKWTFGDNEELVVGGGVIDKASPDQIRKTAIYTFEYYVTGSQTDDDKIIVANFKERDYELIYKIAFRYDGKNVTNGELLKDFSSYEKDGLTFAVRSEADGYYIEASKWVTYGETVTTAEAPTAADLKATYPDRWNWSKWSVDFSVPDVASFSMPKQDVTVSGIFEIKSYFISLQNSSLVRSMTVASVNGNDGSKYYIEGAGWNVPYGAETVITFELFSGNSFSKLSYDGTAERYEKEQDGYAYTLTFSFLTGKETSYKIECGAVGYRLDTYIAMDYENIHTSETLWTALGVDKENVREHNGKTYYFYREAESKYNTSLASVTPDINANTVDSNAYAMTAWSYTDASDHAYGQLTFPDYDLYGYLVLSIKTNELIISSQDYDFDDDPTPVYTAAVNNAPTIRSDGDASGKYNYFTLIRLVYEERSGYEFKNWRIADNTGRTANLTVRELENGYMTVKINNYDTVYYTLSEEDGRTALNLYLTFAATVEAVLTVRTYKAHIYLNEKGGSPDSSGIVMGTTYVDGQMLNYEQESFSFNYNDSLALKMYPGKVEDGKMITAITVINERTSETEETIDIRDGYDLKNFEYATDGEGETKYQTDNCYRDDVSIVVETEKIPYRVTYVLYKTQDSLPNAEVTDYYSLDSEGVTDVDGEENTVTAAGSGYPSLFTVYYNEKALYSKTAENQTQFLGYKELRAALSAQMTEADWNNVLFTGWYLNEPDNTSSENGVMTEYTHIQTKNHVTLYGALLDCVKYQRITDGYAVGFNTAVESDFSVAYETQIKEIVLPTAYAGDPIKAYGFTDVLTDIPYNFAGNDRVHSVHVTADIVSLAEGVFQDCTSLTELTFEEGLEKISAKAFMGCSALTAMTLPTSVTELETDAFRRTGLVEVTLASHLTTIANRAFGGITSLERVYYGLTAPSLNLSSGIFSDSGAVGGFTVTIGKDVETVVTNAFTAQRGVTALVQEEGGKTVTLTEKCFAGTGLTALFINEKMYFIGGNQFSGCKDLLTATFADECAVTAVPDGLFSGCTSLATVTLPAPVRSIGSEAFKGDTALKSVYYQKYYDDYVLSSVGDGAFTTTGTTHGLEEFCDKDLAGTKGVILPESLTSVGANAFSKCKSVVKLTVNGAVAVKKEAFSDDIAIATVILNGRMTIAYDGDVTEATKEDWLAIHHPFFVSDGLTAEKKVVKVGESVTSVADYLFMNANVAAVELGKGLLTVGTKAFANNTAMASIRFNAEQAVDLTATVTPFVGCGTASASGITLLIGGLVKVLPGYWFASANAIRYVDFSSLTEESEFTVNSYAFFGQYFQSVVFPKVKSLTFREKAFSSLDSLQKLTVHEDTERIVFYKNCLPVKTYNKLTVMNKEMDALPVTVSQGTLEVVKDDEGYLCTVSSSAQVTVETENVFNAYVRIVVNGSLTLQNDITVQGSMIKNSGGKVTTGVYNIVGEIFTLADYKTKTAANAVYTKLSAVQSFATDGDLTYNNNHGTLTVNEGVVLTVSRYDTFSFVYGVLCKGTLSVSGTLEAAEDKLSFGGSGALKVQEGGTFVLGSNVLISDRWQYTRYLTVGGTDGTLVYTTAEENCDKNALNEGLLSLGYQVSLVQSYIESSGLKSYTSDGRTYALVPIVRSENASDLPTYLPVLFGAASTGFAWLSDWSGTDTTVTEIGEMPTETEEQLHLRSTDATEGWYLTEGAFFTVTPTDGETTLANGFVMRLQGTAVNISAFEMPHEKDELVIEKNGTLRAEYDAIFYKTTVYGALEVVATVRTNLEKGSFYLGDDGTTVSALSGNVTAEKEIPILAAEMCNVFGHHGAIKYLYNSNTTFADVTAKFGNVLTDAEYTGLGAGKADEQGVTLLSAQSEMTVVYDRAKEIFRTVIPLYGYRSDTRTFGEEILAYLPVEYRATGTVDGGACGCDVENCDRTVTELVRGCCQDDLGITVTDTVYGSYFTSDEYAKYPVMQLSSGTTFAEAEEMLLPYGLTYYTTGVRSTVAERTVSSLKSNMESVYGTYCDGEVYTLMPLSKSTEPETLIGFAVVSFNFRKDGNIVAQAKINALATVTYYAVMTDAVTDVLSGGGTVYLLEDGTSDTLILDKASVTVNIDLGGYTWTVQDGEDAESGIYVSQGTLNLGGSGTIIYSQSGSKSLVRVAGGTFTWNNPALYGTNLGTARSDGSEYLIETAGGTASVCGGEFVRTGGFIRVWGGTVVVRDTTYRGTYGLKLEKGNTTVENSTVAAVQSAVFTDAADSTVCADANKVYLTVTDSVLTSSEGSAVAVMTHSVCTAEDSRIEGSVSALRIGGGAFTLAGTTILSSDKARGEGDAVNGTVVLDEGTQADITLTVASGANVTVTNRADGGDAILHDSSNGDEADERDVTFSWLGQCTLTGRVAEYVAVKHEDDTHTPLIDNIVRDRYGMYIGLTLDASIDKEYYSYYNDIDYALTLTEVGETLYVIAGITLERALTVEAGKTVEFEEEINTGYSVTVAGRMILHGKFTMETKPTLSHPSMTIADGGSVVADGIFYLASQSNLDVQAGGSVTANAGFTVRAYSTLTVNGECVFGGLTVAAYGILTSTDSDASITVHGTLAVEQIGTATLSGRLTVNGALSEGVPTVGGGCLGNSGTLTLTEGSVTALDGKLICSGSTVIGGTVTHTTAETEMNSNLVLSASAVYTGTATKDWTVAENKTFTVNGSFSWSESVLNNGKLHLGGRLTVGKNLTNNSEMIAYDTAYITVNGTMTTDGKTALYLPFDRMTVDAVTVLCSDNISSVIVPKDQLELYRTVVSGAEDNYRKLGDEIPTNWDTVYTAYSVKRDGGSYERNTSADVDGEATYYLPMTVFKEIEGYVKLTEQPSDWETSYSSYYVYRDEIGAYVQNESELWMSGVYYRADGQGVAFVLYKRSAETETVDVRCNAQGYTHSTYAYTWSEDVYNERYAVVADGIRWSIVQSQGTEHEYQAVSLGKTMHYRTHKEYCIYCGLVEETQPRHALGEAELLSAEITVTTSSGTQTNKTVSLLASECIEHCTEDGLYLVYYGGHFATFADINAYLSELTTDATPTCALTGIADGVKSPLLYASRNMSYTESLDGIRFYLVPLNGLGEEAYLLAEYNHGVATYSESATACVSKSGTHLHTYTCTGDDCDITATEEHVYSSFTTVTVEGYDVLRSECVACGATGKVIYYAEDGVTYARINSFLGGDYYCDGVETTDLLDGDALTKVTDGGTEYALVPVTDGTAHVYLLTAFGGHTYYYQGTDLHEISHVGICAGCGKEIVSAHVSSGNGALRKYNLASDGDEESLLFLTEVCSVCGSAYIKCLTVYEGDTAAVGNAALATLGYRFADAESADIIKETVTLSDETYTFGEEYRYCGIESTTGDESGYVMIRFVHRNRYEYVDIHSHNEICQDCGEVLKIVHRDGSEDASSTVTETVSIGGVSYRILGYDCLDCSSFIPYYWEIPHTATFNEVSALIAAKGLTLADKYTSAQRVWKYLKLWYRPVKTEGCFLMEVTGYGEGSSYVLFNLSEHYDFEYTVDADNIGGMLSDKHTAYCPSCLYEERAKHTFADGFDINMTAMSTPILSRTCTECGQVVLYHVDVDCTIDAEDFNELITSSGYLYIASEGEETIGRTVLSSVEKRGIDKDGDGEADYYLVAVREKDGEDTVNILVHFNHVENVKTIEDKDEITCSQCSYSVERDHKTSTISWSEDINGLSSILSTLNTGSVLLTDLEDTPLVHIDGSVAVLHFTDSLTNEDFVALTNNVLSLTPTDSGNSYPNAVLTWKESASKPIAIYDGYIYYVLPVYDADDSYYILSEYESTGSSYFADTAGATVSCVDATFSYGAESIQCELYYNYTGTRQSVASSKNYLSANVGYGTTLKDIEEALYWYGYSYLRLEEPINEDAKVADIIVSGLYYDDIDRPRDDVWTLPIAKTVDLTELSGFLRLSLTVTAYNLGVKRFAIYDWTNESYTVTSSLTDVTIDAYLSGSREYITDTDGNPMIIGCRGKRIFGNLSQSQTAMKNELKDLTARTGDFFDATANSVYATAVENKRTELETLYPGKTITFYLTPVFNKETDWCDFDMILHNGHKVYIVPVTVGYSVESTEITGTVSGISSHIFAYYEAAAEWEWDEIVLFDGWQEDGAPNKEVNGKIVYKTTAIAASDRNYLYYRGNKYDFIGYSSSPAELTFTDDTAAEYVATQTKAKDVTFDLGSTDDGILTARENELLSQYPTGTVTWYLTVVRNGDTEWTEQQKVYRNGTEYYLLTVSPGYTVTVDGEEAASGTVTELTYYMLGIYDPDGTENLDLKQSGSAVTLSCVRQSVDVASEFSVENPGKEIIYFVTKSTTLSELDSMLSSFGYTYLHEENVTVDETELVYRVLGRKTYWSTVERPYEDYWTVPVATVSDSGTCAGFLRVSVHLDDRQQENLQWLKPGAAYETSAEISISGVYCEYCQKPVPYIIEGTETMTFRDLYNTIKLLGFQIENSSVTEYYTSYDESYYTQSGGSYSSTYFTGTVTADTTLYSCRSIFDVYRNSSVSDAEVVVLIKIGNKKVTQTFTTKVGVMEDANTKEVTGYYSEEEVEMSMMSDIYIAVYFPRS